MAIRMTIRVPIVRCVAIGLKGWEMRYVTVLVSIATVGIGVTAVRVTIGRCRGSWARWIGRLAGRRPHSHIAGDRYARRVRSPTEACLSWVVRRPPVAVQRIPSHAGTIP